MRLKYLIVKNFYDQEVPVVFPEHIQHAAVCRGPCVVAGGFFYRPNANNPLVSVYGESESCGVSSREKDSDLIQDAFYPQMSDFHNETGDHQT